MNDQNGNILNKPTSICRWKNLFIQVVSGQPWYAGSNITWEYSNRCVGANSTNSIKIKISKKLKETKLKKILIINLNSAFTFSFYLWSTAYKPKLTSLCSFQLPLVYMYYTTGVVYYYHSNTTVGEHNSKAMCIALEDTHDC